MGGDEDFRSMNDPDFLAERRRVREAIDAMQDRYQRMNDEFDRRAAASWARSGDVA